MHEDHIILLYFIQMTSWSVPARLVATELHVTKTLTCTPVLVWPATPASTAKVWTWLSYHYYKYVFYKATLMSRSLLLCHFSFFLLSSKHWRVCEQSVSDWFNMYWSSERVLVYLWIRLHRNSLLWWVYDMICLKPRLIFYKSCKRIWFSVHVYYELKLM